MPVHDWTRVEAGIFHDFHHAWIEEIKRALNNGVLPADHYALAEQHAAGFGPDVLTLQGKGDTAVSSGPSAADNPGDGGTGVMLASPKIQLTDETDLEFYQRKQNTIAIRHVSGDRIVAMVEVVSPGNKNTRNGLRSFVEKAADLLNKQIHLLILDLHPPGPRDPQGIHGAIWDDVAGKPYALPAGKPITLASYETALSIKAYVVQHAVGEALTDMPLFLLPGAHVVVPLAATYDAAFAAVPRRWRSVLEL